MKRNATAVWNGTIKECAGNLTTDKTVLKNTPYSFDSRFAQGAWSNPEELLAGAHAGCFTVKLSYDLVAAGYPPKKLTSPFTITLQDGKITGSVLSLQAIVVGITNEEF